MKETRPQLIRPWDEENSLLGIWSYKYEINGKDYIVPATISTLEDLEEKYNKEQKIIYWRSGEFDKYMKLGWDLHEGSSGKIKGLPCPVLQLRMIEEMDNFAKGKVYEVLKLFLDKEGKCLNMVQFIYEETYPSETNKYDSENYGLYEWQWFARLNLKTGKCGIKALHAFPENIDRLGDDYPWDELKMIEAAEILGEVKTVDDEAISSIQRAYALFCGFNAYLLQMKPEKAKYNTDRQNHGEMNIFDRYELGQTEMRDQVYVIKRGTTKTKYTGLGTKHSHQYTVTGHERIICGKAIWVKPHIRGEGEFIAKNLGTDAIVKKTVEANKFWRSMIVVKRNARGVFRLLKSGINWFRRILKNWSI